MKEHFFVNIHMKLYSTNNKSKIFTLKEAVMMGLPEDNGLFMPLEIPVLPSSFINNLSDFSFQEISYNIATSLIGDSIPKNDLKSIIDSSISFPAPIVKLNNSTHILELFHGPSLAFKDFGARFMANLMSYYNNGEKLVILVATSGDTGGAVAAGFFNVPGIEVVILYPSGKVSPLQELQLTTFGNNISAIEIDGTFDDCQDIVKKAFLDKNLSSCINLSSANSINIARLIPQSFYYFEAFKQINNSKPIVFSVPSGNFGNLTAGLFAKKMGLPISKFIAATNINDIVPQYLSTGKYTPKKSIRTLSNAMDVGKPSNFSRILDLYSSTWNNIKKDITAFSFNDEETKDCIKRIYSNTNYILDPHGAIGYLAFEKYAILNKGVNGIILETAHPSKFIEVVESVINIKVDIPERLACLTNKEMKNIKLPNDYNVFTSYLLKNRH